MADFLQESETTPYSAVYMKKRIKERFGDDVIFTELDGRPDVVTMRPLAAKILQKFYNEPKKENIKEEEMRFVKTAATCLKNDIKSCPTSKEHYASNSDISSVENALSFLPESLVLLLDTVLVGKDKKCKIASIGQAIMQAARPRALITPLQLGLGVQMHYHFGSRFLVDSLHRHGFCCSYSEVQAYERSAAIKDGVELSIPDGESLVQYVADNVDHNIRTIDGRNTFHGMGIIATITPRNTARPSTFIPRRCNISSDEIAAIGAINIKQYNIASSLQLNIRYDQLLPTEIVDPTSNLDLLWQVSWLLNPRRPSWSGTMQSCHQGEYPGKSSVILLPMIDLDPSNVTCVYSTLDFVSRHARRYDATPILTFDQPLWWKATCIIKGEPTDSPLRQLQIILRLGAFHTEMSFLGSIGHLMRGSGLQEALELIYADNVVPHMLSGKAISRAVRGQLLVETALNTILLSKAYDVPLPTEGERQQDRVKDSNTKDEAKEAQERDSGAETAAESETEEMHTDLKGVKDILESLMQGKTSMEYVCQSHDLENVRRKILKAKSSVSNSRTGKLWLQYLEMIEILRTFIKAERAGDWNLHLQTVQAMLPYFAASGHNLYTKSSRIYLQEMGKLKNDHPHVHDAFQKGFHVIRRSDRYWAGLSSDLIIEQVLMRSLKTSGGLTRGRGMFETQRLIWLLSMSATAEINEAMQEFTEVTFSSSEQHKDTSEARINRDMKDTKSLLSFFEERDPFSDDCSLRNIATGVTAIDTVNADVAKEVGNKILEKMTEQYCKDFVFKRASQAITLDASKHSKATDGDMHVDPQLLFQRLVAVKGYASEDTSKLFSYELCSVPASLFETNGLLREANKPVLASAIRKLVDTEVEIPSQPLKYVLDGGSLLQRLPWKRGTSYASIIDSYVAYVKRKYTKALIVFDGYTGGPSPKDMTHQRRVGTSSGTTVKFQENMLLTLRKEIFLANKENKQRFINMLAAKLKAEGCDVCHANADADLLIVQKGIEASLEAETAVIGEDTDLLVLLIYHANEVSKKIYFYSEPKQNARCINVWDIKLCKELLGIDICNNILFLNAILGCNTTSNLYGIGKGLSLKIFQQNEHLQRQAAVFQNDLATSEEIASAGEHALVCLYKGKEGEGFDALRYNTFCDKAVSGKSVIKPQALPPTSSAAKYHSYRVFAQVMQWKSRDLDPTEWGWIIEDGKMMPLQTDLPYAPEELLKLISCNCKKGCSNLRCSCKKNGLKCTPGCGECRGVSCENAMQADMEDNLEDSL